MMKRFFAVLLLGCMLCLALAGCGKTDLQKSQEYLDTHPPKETKHYSVSFALVSDEKIDDFVLQKMQAKFNEYTEANYNIRVEFTNVTAAEYADWLEEEFDRVEPVYNARVAAEQAALGTGTVPGTEPAPATSAPASDAVTADATGSSGVIGSDLREVYPAIRQDQFDIIYIDSYDTFSSLIAEGRLRDLTEELKVLYRPQTTKDNLTLFESASVGGKIYAVPSSRLQSDYMYVRFNIAKAAEFNYGADSDSSKINYAQISDNSSIKWLKKGLESAGENPDDYIQGGFVGDYAYRFELAEPDENGEATWLVYAKTLKDETVSPAVELSHMPSINKSDLMNGMLAVTKFAYVDNNGTLTTDKDDYCPAVRILHAIETNPELHTVLQYGAEGLTYTLQNVVNGDEVVTVVKKLTENEYSYEIDPKYTGSIFSLYPTIEEYEKNYATGVEWTTYNWKQYTDTKITGDIIDFKLEITQPKDAGCTATLSTTFGRNGQTVILTAVPATGYQVTSWVIKAPSDGDPDTSLAGDEEGAKPLVIEYEVNNPPTGTFKVTFDKIPESTAAQGTGPAAEE